MKIINWIRWLLAKLLIKCTLILATVLLTIFPKKRLLDNILEQQNVFVNLSPEELEKKKRITNGQAINVRTRHHDPQKFYMAALRDHALELMDDYVDGHWDCDELDELLARGLRSETIKRPEAIFHRFLNFLRYDLMNPQGIDEAWETGRKHYDFGNEHFKAFLGPSMVYSCAYWKNAKNLDEAQHHKMELIARKLKLKKGGPPLRILDIGCGWGSLAKFLAQDYGAEVVGVTVSKEGAQFAKIICKGLKVDIRVQDFRTIDEKFDRIVCVEMMEHIGPNSYRTFFELAHRCLHDDGLFFLHVMAADNNRVLQFSPWLHSRVIANAYIPSPLQLVKAMANLWTIEDLHNIGPDFCRTFEGWADNFEGAWPQLKRLYGEEEQEKIYRTWMLYFNVGQAMWRARGLQMWHLVFSKVGHVETTYEAER